MTDGAGVMTDDTGVINAGPVRGRAVRAAVRAGINAGWIELSHCFTMLEDSFEILFFTLVSVVVLVAANAKHTHVPGTHFLIGSTLIVEQVFALPGVGSLLVQSIFQRDFPVVQAVALVFGVMVVVVNLLTDVAYATLDPRVRFD